MTPTVPYWMIEASKDGVVFDRTFVQGISKANAVTLATALQDGHPEGWQPDVVFAVIDEPLSPAQLAEVMLA